VLIEEQVVVPKMGSAHVPVKVREPSNSSAAFVLSNSDAKRTKNFSPCYPRQGELRIALRELPH
jgi:hypothetical protein